VTTSSAATDPERGSPGRAAWPLALLAALLVVAAVSAIEPSSYGNWIAETFPVFLGVGVLAGTWRRFQFTSLTYGAAFVFAVVLLVGGHFTYARVPLGEWMKGWFGFERNHFDRVGHFLQGVVPALIVRERLLRRSPLPRGPRLFCIVLGCSLAISALYEIFEWRYAVAFGGDAADDFLGSQGDPWDAQQDMTAALLGAAAAQLVLGRIHDRQMAVLEPRPVDA
jgi:putative membrane protein